MPRQTLRWPFLVMIVVGVVFVIFDIWSIGSARRGVRPVAARPAVACLVPAATDLIIAMGAADHLVAVSSFDDQPQVANRPRFGDYNSIDWEKLALAKPEILITQFGADRFPDGLRQRCQQNGIRILNIHVETIPDIEKLTRQLGDAINESAKAQSAAESIQSRLDAVARQVAGNPPIRVLLVGSEGSSGLNVIGGGTFLDEALAIAGGVNVVHDRPGYSTIDRETLLKLAPDAVIQLLPGAGKTPQVLQESELFWKSVPDLSAVRNHRIYTITDSWSLLPGSHVPDLAQQFAQRLHPAD